MGKCNEIISKVVQNDNDGEDILEGSNYVKWTLKKSLHRRYPVLQYTVSMGIVDIIVIDTIKIT